MKAKEIAKELGISPATVSLALNDRPGVSRETKERVMDYVYQKEEEFLEGRIRQVDLHQAKGTVLMLNYVKNGTIMEQKERFQLPSSSGSPTLIEKAAQISAGRGYRFRYRIFRERHHSLDQLLQECRDTGVSGIYILAAEMFPGDIYPFRNLNIPIVIGDNLFYEEGIDSYLIDNQEGIARCVDYLADKGHSHIAYLAENINIFNFAERRDAFLMEMMKRGMGDARNRIWYLGSSINEVYDSMKRNLDRGIQRTTAFVLESSVVSLGVCKALMERQVRIPRDLSLIGFDAVTPDSLPGVELTLIKGTHTKRHLAGIRHLMEHMEDGNEEIMKVYYHTKLLEGNSVFDKTRFIYKTQRG